MIAVSEEGRKLDIFEQCRILNNRQLLKVSQRI